MISSKFLSAHMLPSDVRTRIRHRLTEPVDGEFQVVVPFLPLSNAAAPVKSRGRHANCAFSARLPHLSGGGGFFPPFGGADGGNRSRLRRGTTSERMSWNRDPLSSRAECGRG